MFACKLFFYNYWIIGNFLTNSVRPALDKSMFIYIYKV